MICCNTNKNAKNIKAKSTFANPQVSVCYYQPYQTAHGKGKGIIFSISLENEYQLNLDSLIIGGKHISIAVLQTKPLIIEGNYLLNKPEPSEENLYPAFAIDSIIDFQKFNPAYLIMNDSNAHSYKIVIQKFIKKHQ
jgi:hypothetical protein